MTCYTGCIAAVPVANKDKYLEHVKAVWPLFRKRGAIRTVETWGVEIPRGKQNDLYGAVEAAEDEAVVFSWIEWPDLQTANDAWQSMGDDPEIKDVPGMPFDGSRMIFGNFEPVFAHGTESGAGYYQGFALPVPKANRDPYVAMAESAWNDMFAPHGCIGTVECWGIDVPRGKKTDFYRATLAKEDEVPVFSWTAWPDRATCDAAAKAMEASMQEVEMPDMPFDGARMIWGGFETLFVSERDR